MWILWLLGAGCGAVCGDGTEPVGGECRPAFTCLDACFKVEETCFGGGDVAACVATCEAGGGYDVACVRDAACGVVQTCRPPTSEDAMSACSSLCAVPLVDIDPRPTCDDGRVAQCEQRCFALTRGFGPVCLDCLVDGGRETQAGGGVCTVGSLGAFPACADRCEGGEPVWGPVEASAVCEAWCAEVAAPDGSAGCGREAVDVCEAGCVAAVQGKSQRCGACLLLEDAPPTFDGDRCVEPTFAAAPACAYLCGE